MAQHERVETEKPFLEPRRGHLRNLVVVEHKRLQLSELREHGRRNAPHVVARGVEDLQVPQRPHAVQSLAGKLIARGGEISDLAQKNNIRSISRLG